MNADASAAKMMRQIPDRINYQARFEQSQTRIKFDYIVKILTTERKLAELSVGQSSILLN